MMDAHQRRNGAVELVGRHDPVDQSPVARRCRIDELAGEQHLEGPLRADAARQRNRRRGAEQPDVDARGRKARRLGRHHEVARRHQLATARRGHALHARDDRLRQRADAPHQVRAIGEQALVVVELRLASHLAQVVPGAECLAGGADHHDAHRRIGGRAGQRLVQRRQHFLGKRVVLLGTIEREPQHAAALTCCRHGTAGHAAARRGSWSRLPVTVAPARAHGSRRCGPARSGCSRLRAN